MTHIFNKQGMASHLLSYIWIYHIHNIMLYVCIYDNVTHTHTHIVVVVETQSCYIPQGLYFPEFLQPQPPEYQGDRHAAPHLAVIYWVLEQAKFWNSVIFHEKFTSGLLLQSLLQKKEVLGDVHIFHKILIPPSSSLKQTLYWDVSVCEGPQNKQPIATIIS